MIQITVAKIKGYGPWTLTLGSDREHRLQMLQASLYAETQRLFSEKDCLVFPNRYDEYIIVSNGLDADGHRAIQNTLAEKFAVKLQMHTGMAETPYEANVMAQLSMANDGFVNGQGSADDITVLHLDVDDLSSKAQAVSAYDISLLILKLHGTMAKYFVERQSLSFFMGGDNFMVLASARGRKEIQEFIDATHDSLDVALNCGVGCAPRGRQAAALATKSLDTIREIRDSGRPRPQIYQAC